MKIWIISLYFNQENFIASERIKRISRYLSKKHNLKIFTTNHGGPRVSKKYEFEVVNSSIFFNDYIFRNYNIKNKITKKNLFPKIISKIFGDSGWVWYFQLKKSVFKEIKYRGKPDLVIASGSPFLPFYLCYELKKKFQIPYLLDYRDAWSNNPSRYKSNSIFQIIPKIIESKVNKESKSIISVSSATANGILKAKDKIVIYNLPDKTYTNYLRSLTKNININKNFLKLTLTGSLYQYQTLDSICLAIKMLNCNLRKKIILDYCGPSWRYVDFIFEKYKIKNNLINHRFINKDKAIKVLAKGDIAISIISCVRGEFNQTIKGEITTKIFDYISLGKNIINLSFDDYEIIELLKKIKYKNLINVDPNDTKKLKKLFETAIKEKIKFKKIKLIDSNSITGLLKESNANLKRLENNLKELQQ